MDENEAQAKQQMYNFLFLGEKADALLPFFKQLFDMGIEFPRASGMFYYPSRVSDTCLIRAFAAFPSSLEMIATPKEFGDADCIVLVINVQNNEHFGDFVPYFQAILEKKLACPPVAIVGITLHHERAREVSYFGMVALKHFIATTFKPAETHLIEWNVHRKTGTEKHIRSTFADIMRAVDRERHDTRPVLSRTAVRNEAINLKRELQSWKFLDKRAGLKHLIADEQFCMHGMNRASSRFHGYNRELLVRHGLDASFAKDILDEWENLDDVDTVSKGEVEAVRREHVNLFEAKRKYLAPRSLSELIIGTHMDLPVAKAVLRELRDDKHEVDIHHTQSIVEELSSITELIIIFASQPIFYHLPNEKMGVGSVDNIEMLSGMFHVLDILRNQVYTTEQEEKKTVEKIKYGSLNLTIAHGRRAKCVIHSLRGLTDDMLKKVERYLDSFELTFASRLDDYKGEVNVFNDTGRKLYDDIFTPLPLNQVNTNWRVANTGDESRDVLTSNQVRVLDSIARMQAEGVIGVKFHLEDIFSQIASRARLSQSDLLLLLPGELLVRDSPAP
ncbi:MAG: hypothetical protein JW839_06875 [Candidatus Lokiarchaeota archaeon]|nr:hypothetical protein [Candidatus Lokiarchaeota archaeon]